MSHHIPICTFCKHFRRLTTDDVPDNVTELTPEGPYCAAFPHGIPTDVWYESRRHVRHVEGDRGLKFELRNPDDEERFERFLYVQPLHGRRVMSTEQPIDLGLLSDGVARVAVGILNQIEDGHLEVGPSGAGLLRWLQYRKFVRENLAGVPVRTKPDGSRILQRYYVARSEPTVIGYVTGTDRDAQRGLVSRTCTGDLAYQLAEVHEDESAIRGHVADHLDSGLAAATRTANALGCAIAVRRLADLRPDLPSLLQHLVGTLGSGPPIIAMEDAFDSTSGEATSFITMASYELAEPKFHPLPERSENR